MMGEEKPNLTQITAVVLKLVKALPHDNVAMYEDNGKLLQQLMQFPGVYVEKNMVKNMITVAKDKEDSSEWFMGGMVVLKHCLAYKVPVLTPD